MPDFDPRLESIRITSLTIAISPTSGTQKHILSLEWMNKCWVHAHKGLSVTWGEMKCLHPESKKERLVSVPYLAFTSPGQKEAKFIYFEEAVRFKHKGFL